jgi:hypothetical protein
MGRHRYDTLCASTDESYSRLAKSRGGIDHVINDHTGASLHVADYPHLSDVVWTGTPFVDYRHRGIVEPSCKDSGSFNPTRIGRYRRYFVGSSVVSPHEGTQNRKCIQVVDGDIEESHDLASMKVGC